MGGVPLFNEFNQQRQQKMRQSVSKRVNHPPLFFYFSSSFSTIIQHSTILSFYVSISIIRLYKYGMEGAKNSHTTSPTYISKDFLFVKWAPFQHSIYHHSLVFLPSWTIVHTTLFAGKVEFHADLFFTNHIRDCIIVFITVIQR